MPPKITAKPHKAAMENVLEKKIQTIGKDLKEILEWLEMVDNEKHAERLQAILAENLDRVEENRKKRAERAAPKSTIDKIVLGKTIQPISTDLATRITDLVFNYPHAIFTVADLIRHVNNQISLLPQTVAQERISQAIEKLVSLGLLHATSLYNELYFKETKADRLTKLNIIGFSATNWIENMMMNGKLTILQQIKKYDRYGEITHRLIDTSPILNIYELGIIQYHKSRFKMTDVFMSNFLNLCVQEECISKLMQQRIIEKRDDLYVKITRMDPNIRAFYGISDMLYGILRKEWIDYEELLKPIEYRFPTVRQSAGARLGPFEHFDPNQVYPQTPSPSQIRFESLITSSISRVDAFQLEILSKMPVLFNNGHVSQIRLVSSNAKQAVEALMRLENMRLIYRSSAKVDCMNGVCFVKEIRAEKLEQIVVEHPQIMQIIREKIANPFEIDTFSLENKRKYLEIGNMKSLNREFQDVIRYLHVLSTLNYSTANIKKMRSILYLNQFSTQPSPSPPMVPSPLPNEVQVKIEVDDEISIDTLMKPPPTKKNRKSDENEVKKEIKEEIIDEN